MFCEKNSKGPCNFPSSGTEYVYFGALPGPTRTNSEVQVTSFVLSTSHRRTEADGIALKPRRLEPDKPSAMPHYYSRPPNLQSRVPSALGEEMAPRTADSSSEMNWAIFVPMRLSGNPKWVGSDSIPWRWGLRV